MAKAPLQCSITGIQKYALDCSGNQTGGTGEAPKLMRKSGRKVLLLAFSSWDWRSSNTVLEVGSSNALDFRRGKEKIQNYRVTHTSPTTKTFCCPLIEVMRTVI